MSYFLDYEKVMKAFLADGADNASSVMKPVAETQAKLSKIALAAAKDSIAASQSWANQSIASLEPLTKPASTPTELAAASTAFARSQIEAAPKHLAGFADIAKAAQVATMDVMLDAGRAGMAAAGTKAEPATTMETAETEAPMTTAPIGKVKMEAEKKAKVKLTVAKLANSDANATQK